MRIGILGYGNLGRACEIACAHDSDTDLVGIFTRREPEHVRNIFAQVYHESMLEKFKKKIDVLLVCTGSASDTPRVAPRLSASFSTVDSYDNHRMLYKYRSELDRHAKENGNVSIVGAGWDPGLLSLIRLYSRAFMPYAQENTFWGEGVSQGHSEALRSIPGVIDAIQFTVPFESALTLARTTKTCFKSTEKHKRICYIVAENGEESKIAKKVKELTDYFGGYQTQINFVSESEFERYKYSRQHRGRVIAHGFTGLYRENAETLELDLRISSNPEFTAGVMIACAKVGEKMKKEGHRGAFTLFDIPPSYFLDEDKCTGLL